MIRGIVSGSFWGVVSKLVDGLVRFFTIPMLVAYFGKANFGLVTLAFSLNAYLRILDLGLNVGSVRFLSIWLTENNLTAIKKASGSGLVFYGAIGIVNAIIFVFIGFHGSFFNIATNQVSTFQILMFVLAFSAILNWMSNVVLQLLVAAGQIGWVNRLSLFTSVLTLLLAIVSVKWRFPLTTYFIAYTIVLTLGIPLMVQRLAIFKLPRRSLLTPQWKYQTFKNVLWYSLSIFAMGFFQFSADSIRPIILSRYSSQGISVLTDYRIIQTIASLLMAFGGIFLQVLLPVVSKMHANKDHQRISHLISYGTKYLTAFLSFSVFLIVSNSRLLLTLYMGTEYADLATWLNVWLFTVLIALHNIPVSSLVLATGKTRKLVYSSAISFFVSTIFNLLLTPKYNLGASVIAYLLYVLLQIAFYYIYYIPFVLKVDSISLFLKSFLPPIAIGLTSLSIVSLVDHFFPGQINWIKLGIKTLIFSGIFSLLLFKFVVSISELKSLLGKIFRLHSQNGLVSE